ncbi:MAG TPA: hypothetical protein VMX75_05815 [Spirochaetia bacterium]|nr:hypothetical protein [Spirochaetia bacterium]
MAKSIWPAGSGFNEANPGIYFASTVPRMGALYRQAIPFRTISLDGKPNDWEGIAPILNTSARLDPDRRSGTDIRSIYLAADEKYIYARVDLADGDPNTGIWYNIDLQLVDNHLLVFHHKFHKGRWVAILVKHSRTSHQSVTVGYGRIRVSGGFLESAYSKRDIFRQIEPRVTVISATSGDSQSGKVITSLRPGNMALW